jgi:hypothetical protein
MDGGQAEAELCRKDVRGANAQPDENLSEDLGSQNAQIGYPIG